MIVKLLTEHHLEFLSLKGGCRGLSESTHVKMTQCWKSHAVAQFGMLFYLISLPNSFLASRDFCYLLITKPLQAVGPRSGLTEHQSLSGSFSKSSFRNTISLKQFGSRSERTLLVLVQTGCRSICHKKKLRCFFFVCFIFGSDIKKALMLLFFVVVFLVSSLGSDIKKMLFF